MAGKSKLTDQVIDRLTHYYVRRNVRKTAQDFKNDILSTYYHVTSTDDNPHHGQCPTGRESWCFYNVALAKNETSPSHIRMKVKFSLQPEERKKVLQIYISLRDDDLLQRCLKGRTQNPNESFHSKVWSTISKSNFYSHEADQFSMALTALYHNFGHEGAEIFLKMAVSTQIFFIGSGGRTK